MAGTSVIHGNHGVREPKETMILPPGTILQLLYLKERLRRQPRATFIEIGVGTGYYSKCLLAMGWTGVGYDIDEVSVAKARALNAEAVSSGRYRVVAGDWLRANEAPKVELILSAMVLEHLYERDSVRFLEVCAQHLAPGGKCIFFVPGSPLDWGIEDEIAGHYRRYTQAELKKEIESAGLIVRHIAGLNYPISNVLLPLSNYLTYRTENQKRRLPMLERTKLSGRRNVPGKTHMPAFMSLFVNRWALYPFHLLQKVFSGAERALVIYVECEPSRDETPPGGETRRVPAS